MKKNVLILIIILVVAGAGAIAFFQYKKKKEKKSFDSKVTKTIGQIKRNASWLAQETKTAEEKGITLDQQLYNAAVWKVNNS